MKTYKKPNSRLIVVKYHHLMDTSVGSGDNSSEGNITEGHAKNSIWESMDED